MFLRVDINIITAILLFFVLKNAFKTLSRKDKLNRVILAISQITLIELVVEALSCVVNKREGLSWIIISKILHTILFVLTPTVAYLWSHFLYTFVPDNNKKISMKVFIIPLIISAVVSSTSAFTDLVFIIDDHNVYRHGRLFVLPAIVSYFYLAYNCIYVIKERKKLTNNEFTALISFVIIPSIAGILQLFLRGALLMWSSTAIGLIIIFIYLHQKMIQIDSLTGAWTRSSFENYLEERMAKGFKESGFTVIFIDLDKFKQINDNHGHLEGDKALKNTVKVIKSALEGEDIIARFGGDEFVVLLNTVNRIKIEKALGSLQSEFDTYNEVSGKPYKIEYSYGYEIYNRRRYKNIVHFLSRVDGLMYKNKVGK